MEMNSSRDPDIFCPHTPPYSKRQDTEARKKERGYQQLEVLEISGNLGIQGPEERGS